MTPTQPLLTSRWRRRKDSIIVFILAIKRRLDSMFWAIFLYAVAKLLDAWPKLSWSSPIIDVLRYTTHCKLIQLRHYMWFTRNRMVHWSPSWDDCSLMILYTEWEKEHVSRNAHFLSYPIPYKSHVQSSSSCQDSCSNLALITSNRLFPPSHLLTNQKNQLQTGLSESAFKWIEIHKPRSFSSHPQIQSILLIADTGTGLWSVRSLSVWTWCSTSSTASLQAIWNGKLP